MNSQVNERKNMDECQDDVNEDVLIRLRHDCGVEVTFLTAPQELFSDGDDLYPIITWLSEIDVYLAFNEYVLNNLIEESINLNGELYGEQAAAFLPLQHMIQLGLSAIDKILAKQ